MQFRGRKTYLDKGYPAVYWPDHPLARENGAITVHRAVAYEEWGEAVRDLHVHHIDENPRNWSIDNLMLVTCSEHSYIHNVGGEVAEPVERFCSECGGIVEVWQSARKKRDTVYCDITCMARGNEKIDWPSVPELLSLVEETSYIEAGRRLGVSDNAVRKRIRNHS